MRRWNPKKKNKGSGARFSSLGFFFFFFLVANFEFSWLPRGTDQSWSKGGNSTSTDGSAIVCDVELGPMLGTE